MNPHFNSFSKQILNPLKFRFFMLQRLPSAFFAGLRIRKFQHDQAVISVRFKWFNQNPFRSMYFAIQSMAAEMSTGLLGFGQIYQRDPAVSMLVTSISGKFYKKATDTVSFTCLHGKEIDDAIEAAIRTGEGTSVVCLSTGTNIAGEVVSEFIVTWSFKVKSKKL